MIKFSFLLLTYNRRDLVRHAIASILKQDYEQFELIVIDNGSQPPINDIVHAFNDQRATYYRHDKNIHGCDALEFALTYTTGTHLLFIADDDVLVPGALKRVADFFTSHPEAEFLQGGFVDFNHIDRTSKTSLSKLNSFDGRVESFDGEENAIYYCNGWGIGEKKPYRATPMAHASTAFISTGLLRRVKHKQGAVFIKPFGDIGYVGCSANTNKIYYLNFPLAVIGETLVREMVGSQRGKRHKWDQEIEHLMYSPLKGPSFVNMGMDAHLKIMHANGLHDKFDTRLRPDFFVRHLSQVISDSPWDARTFHDIGEVMPHYAKSLFQFISLNALVVKLVLYPLSLLKRIIRRIRKYTKNHTKPDRTNTYSNINEFARWVHISTTNH